MRRTNGIKQINDLSKIIKEEVYNNLKNLVKDKNIYDGMDFDLDFHIYQGKYGSKLIVGGSALFSQWNGIHDSITESLKKVWNYAHKDKSDKDIEFILMYVLDSKTIYIDFPILHFKYNRKKDTFTKSSSKGRKRPSFIKEGTIIPKSPFKDDLTESLHNIINKKIKKEIRNIAKNKKVNPTSKVMCSLYVYPYNSTPTSIALTHVIVFATLKYGIDTISVSNNYSESLELIAHKARNNDDPNRQFVIGGFIEYNKEYGTDKDKPYIGFNQDIEPFVVKSNKWNQLFKTVYYHTLSEWDPISFTSESPFYDSKTTADETVYGSIIDMAAHNLKYTNYDEFKKVLDDLTNEEDFLQKAITQYPHLILTNPLKDMIRKDDKEKRGKRKTIESQNLEIITYLDKIVDIFEKIYQIVEDSDGH